MPEEPRRPGRPSAAPDELRRGVVELLLSVPDIKIRHIARLVGVSHGTVERWRNQYAPEIAAQLATYARLQPSVHLQGALLAVESGLERTVAVRLALGLVRLARLQETARPEGTPADVAEASTRETIAALRADLADLDPALPVVEWTRGHLDHVQADLDRPARPAGSTAAEPRGLDAEPSWAQLGLEGHEDDVPLFDAAGLAVAPSSLSVGELLQDADVAARDLLYAPEGHQAAAMVRSWTPLVAAAVSVLDALPKAPVAIPGETTPGVSPAARFAQEMLERANSLQSSAAEHSWPPAGPGDIRLDQITSTLEAAAKMIRERPVEGQADALATGAARPAVHDDLDAARAMATHALYMATHAVGLALQERRGEGGRKWGSGWHQHTQAIERILEPEIPGFSAAVAGMRTGTSDEDRLPAALERWRLQVARVLGDHPNPASLALIARTQSVTAAPILMIAKAGVLADEIVPDRVIAASQEAGPAWSELSDRWRDFTETHTADHALNQAAAELRAACRTFTHNPDGPAPAEEIAARPGIEAAFRSLLDAAAQGPEIASRLLQAADDPALRGPAKVMLRRTDQEAEEFGLTSYAQVTLGEGARGLVVPTALVRQALARLTYTAARAAQSLDAAAQVRSGTPALPAGHQASTPADELRNVDDVAAELAWAEQVCAQLTEQLDAFKAWSAGMADRWRRSAWGTAELDAAISELAETSAALGDLDAPAAALHRLDDAIAAARRLGEVLRESGATGTIKPADPDSSQ